MSLQRKLLKSELTSELDSILKYWSEHTVDEQNGGFAGQIDFNDQRIENAEKGSVLNARILWTFSASYQTTKNENHKKLAERAFEFLSAYFYDTKFGGLFWSINEDKTPKDTKNQIYALAFAIYGLSEYYVISKNEKALEIAKNLYLKIQEHSYDPVNKGYFEAFTRDWQPIEDLRLSAKDANEKKTMNTHLHIIEGYVNLYKVWKDEKLLEDIIELLETIEKYFINTETAHLRLFFNENWVEKPDVISYGHDIEAAWLLQQCAEISGNEKLIENYKKYAVQIAEVTKEGLDSDGGLWYEFDPEKNKLIAEKHWWPQAESLIGFYNAYQLTEKEEYLEIVYKNWKFIKKHILDQKNGEWVWGIYHDYSLIEKDKAGFWKCPYHNGRACLELIQRIKE
ncbi:MULTISPECIES: AGE family epimerase/isomerase [unclassified Flavobacterium]|uniref:AGE family epimerase/isomerase n=1 Tax=unclassified Flavobacterium TaxID=196869 RepID=UPI001066FADB|nr:MULTISPECIES: AGE family epimerase/isomerase [unclassified Flavobacterium]MDQ1167077.1 mannobiose 2-epimerase [Flavobacterium sp. SORGH_AS_0622]TDX12280.1 mannobiose 2-epimerase [Flavobacterium sp. S87F.05.LMB.W.Kidney.N]